MSGFIAKIVSVFVGIVSVILPLTSTGSTEIAPKPTAPAIVKHTDIKKQELKIMTYNVYIGGKGAQSPDNRLNGVAQTILAQNPDSIGLQEADEFWRWNLKFALREKYAIACDYGRHLGMSEGSPIFYRKDKFKLIDEGTFWLSDTPGLYSMGWDAASVRIAAWALLEDKTTGFRYYHYNAHLDHLGEAARINAAALIANKINAPNLPTVLTGDFNFAPSHRGYSYLTGAGIKDTRTLATQTKDSGRTFHGYANVTTRSGNPIDFVFANQQYLRAVRSYDIVHTRYDGMYPSDHFAVVSILTLANQ
ncbi:MAG: endonuclease/exonuclease/phosphatase family protein [Oscillospiraceae bacterium]|jgi:endonuclease/exonuclease/phosphatase family metal-dependent hydrolase|nr:endonuclease/exonuclease/phosphatase family protein [Oscillospiraceae bacterium]